MQLAERRTRAIAAVAAIALIAAAWTLAPRAAHAATTSTRLAGADRYGTAVEISKAQFPTNSIPEAGTPLVFVATGEAFPDALAVGAAAAKKDAPVLLTQKDTLPSATATELDRLKPNKIIVLGGVDAVGDAVKTALGTHLTTGGSVDRYSGVDRYATAALISNQTFAPSVPVVYVATGTAFPDALSGGPAAFDDGGPLLLVTKDAIPSATQEELTRLAATKVIVLGGTAAVSDAVVTALDAYSVDPVLRRQGTDRVLTAVDVSKGAFNKADAVFLATGTNFPDALAAGSYAGTSHAPVLLVQPTCVPAEVNAEIDRLEATKVYVLGGESVLSNAIMSRTACPSPSSSTTSTSLDLTTCITDLSSCLPIGGLGDLLPLGG
jgi:putative cell wall-binding protein